MKKLLFLSVLISILFFSCTSYETLRNRMDEGCKNNDMEKIKDVINSSFGIDNCLSIAIDNNNQEACKLILENGADPSPGLIIAAKNKNIALCELLLRSKANPNTDSDDESYTICDTVFLRTGNGDYPYVTFNEEGSPVKIFSIDAYIQVRYKVSSHRKTAMYYAIEQNNKALVELLLRNGYDTKVTYPDGTILEHNYLAKAPSIFFRFNSKSKFDFTWGTAYVRSSGDGWIYSSDPDLVTHTPKLITPLQHAIKKNNKEIIKLLTDK